jgi:FkbM family methyltransferase
MRAKVRNAIRRISKLSQLLSHPQYRRGLGLGVAAGIEHEAVLRTLRCRTVVDVGANIGQFSLATRVCIPGARILAFEPLGKPAEKFERLFQEDDQVALHRAGIAPRRERTRMHVSARIDSSSLLPSTETQTAVFPGTAQTGTEEVEVGPLSAFIKPADLVGPCLLKLDVQGFELKALQGCSDLLSMFEYVYVEASFVELYEGQALADEVLMFLRDFGFALHGVHNMIYDRAGHAVQGDMLLNRRARHQVDRG